jgi:hypothetical protein
MSCLDSLAGAALENAYLYSCACAARASAVFHRQQSELAVLQQPFSVYENKAPDSPATANARLKPAGGQLASPARPSPAGQPASPVFVEPCVQTRRAEVGSLTHHFPSVQPRCRPMRPGLGLCGHGRWRESSVRTAENGACCVLCARLSGWCASSRCA